MSGVTTAHLGGNQLPKLLNESEEVGARRWLDVTALPVDWLVIKVDVSTELMLSSTPD